MEEQIKQLEQDIVDLQTNLTSSATLEDLLDEIDALVEKLLNMNDVQNTTPTSRIKSNKYHLIFYLCKEVNFFFNYF